MGARHFPGIRDDAVLVLAHAEGRILLTFDKDFGEMALEQGKTVAPGVILLRPRLRSPEHVAQFTVALLSQPIDWAGNFPSPNKDAFALYQCPIKPSCSKECASE